MTLIEMLREAAGLTKKEDELFDEAADALEAQEKRIKELEGALQNILEEYEQGIDDGWEAALERAREVLRGEGK